MLGRRPTAPTLPPPSSSTTTYYLAAGDYLLTNARYHSCQRRRPYVASSQQADEFDALAAAPGGVARKTQRHTHGFGESYPYCARHLHQRIDAEPCLRCRVDLLELKLTGAERELGGLKSTLEDVAPKLLSLNDAVMTLVSLRSAGVVVDRQQ